jgi:phosphate transport system substrate-binding protein
MNAWQKAGNMWLLAGMILLACHAGLAEAQVKPEVDPALKPYDRNGSSKVEGTLLAGASESIRRLFDLWTERFQRHHPGVKFETTGILNSEAAQAAFKGTAPIKEGADLVAVSFPLSEGDLQAIKAQRGVMPVRAAVALDALVLVVNHKNPLPGLTLPQVAEIYTAVPNQKEEVELWNHVGVNGKFGALEINRYGRDRTSGTYMAFKSMALHGGEQRKDVHKEPGSMSVVLEVGADERGIGYAATGYAARSKRVRVVPLARRSGDRFVTPTNETVLSGEYPLLRELYIYAMPEADGKLRPALKSFLQFMLSRDGQELAREEGFFPLPATHSEQVLGGLERDGRVSSTEASTKID